MNAEEYDRATHDYEEIHVHQSGKRCGMQHTPWMGDFFTSWSPRNGNSNAEGPWEHWVDLAVRILQDPMTAIVRPDAAEAARGIEKRDFYAEADRYLTE